MIHVTITDLKLLLYARELIFEPGADFAKACMDADPVTGSTHALHAAINWAWLQWHARDDFRRIRDQLSFVVLRSASGLTKEMPNSTRMRGFHDWLLMCSAVLSGEASVIRAGAASVIPASSCASGDHYYAALAGIIAGRTYEETRIDVGGQMEVFERLQPDKAFIAPTRALVRAFVKGNWLALDKAVAKGAERHWSEAYLGKESNGYSVIVEKSEEEIKLELARKNANYLWPYPEAVFAKLAIAKGASISHDDFWFPRAFVSARL
jgi:hypothetical protein